MIGIPQRMRGLIAGFAGGIAWLLGLAIFFFPAQAILTNPELQSAKFLAVFTQEPAPRMVATPWVLPAGILLIGLVWGQVYVWVSGGWGGAWWRKGLCFGALAWALMVPWFEFYLPWNVMREPLPLVLLEMGCWALVLGLVGLTIAGVERLLRPRAVER